MITLQTIGEEVGALVRVPAGRTVTFAYTTTDLDNATFFAEISYNDASSFQLLGSIVGNAGAQSGTHRVVNDTKSDWYLRSRAVETAASFTGTVDVTYTQLAATVGYINDEKGNAIVEITDQGLLFLQPITSVTIAALTGTVISGTAGSLIVPEYASNAAALADGQPIGALWKTSAGVVAAVVAA